MAFIDIPEVGQTPPGDLRFSRTLRTDSYDPYFYPDGYRDTSDEAWSRAQESFAAPVTSILGPDPTGGGAQAARGRTLFLASGLMTAQKNKDASTGEVTVGNYYAFLKECTDWHMVFYSATCYVKVWWNLVVRKSASPDLSLTTVLSSDAQEWEWTGEDIEDGCCCKANLDPLATATWNVSDYADSVAADVLRPEDPDPPEPGGTVGNPSSAANFLSVYLENIRWSFVEGYVPPPDGSANGFPP